MAGKVAPRTSTRISRLGQRRQIVIPREILDGLELREGDFVAIQRKGNGVLVTPTRVAEPHDTLTLKEAKMVRRGEAQLRQGKSKSWRDVKNALAR
jgi:AbrB family looped-hinge helix DNA binding protein